MRCTEDSAVHPEVTSLLWREGASFLTLGVFLEGCHEVSNDPVIGPNAYMWRTNQSS